ncbi:MAG: hypothetical protein R2822_12980 [Spirosomataceae bacterium]
MKISVKLSIFAIVFGIVLVNVKAIAEEKSKTSSNTKTIALANAQQKAFEDYISEQFTPFTEQEDWKVFVEVVTYYNNSPSKMINVPAEKQQQFNNATRLLIHAVGNSKDENAKFWLNNLKKTTHNIHFIWHSNWDYLTPNEEIQIEPIHQLNGF